jgi:glycine/D-amino acid oxidase-like deaminating enzyme
VKHARQLCPALRYAPVVSAWAGVRPQSSARDPIAGQLLPECPIHIATGGFKITLGIAHMVADSLIAGLVRGRPASGMPATFSPEVHLAAAKRAAAIQASDMSGNRQ